MSSIIISNLHIYTKQDWENFPGAEPFKNSDPIAGIVYVEDVECTISIDSCSAVITDVHGVDLEFSWNDLNSFMSLQYILLNLSKCLYSGKSAFDKDSLRYNKLLTNGWTELK